jgi:ribosomal-protein-alanine N-acetyltransferase
MHPIDGLAEFLPDSWFATDSRALHEIASRADLNADPRVMEYLPKTLGRVEYDSLAAHIAGHFERHGSDLWAVEVLGVWPSIGLVGLAVPAFEAHFTPCVEVGWRLAHEHWGRGYATEAASLTDS